MKTIAEARAKFGKLTAARRDSGERIVVMRPASTATHVAAALHAHATQNTEILPALLEEQFTFVGYLALASKREPYAVDGNGVIVDRVEPGDSLIDENGVTKAD